MKQHYIVSIFIIALFSSTLNAMAHSTIYVDDIGRLHFLGKDPGSKAKYVQQMGDFNNPIQKDLTNIKYKNSENLTNDASQQNFENKKNYSENSGFANDTSVESSKTYTYNTNTQSGVNNSKTIYTDDLGRQHFFRKDNIIKE